MIILTSNGLSNNKLIDRAKIYITKGKAALVVTADNEYKENNHHINRLTKELELLGLSVECFDFDNQSPTELMKYDVVELMGGNPYYLLNSIRKNNFYEVLQYFAKDKFIIGCSAGALVLTHSLNLIDLYSPEMNIVELKDLSACNFTDIEILPHYSKFLNKYDEFEEKCYKYEKEYNCKVVRLNDGEGILINEDEISIIK